MKPISAYLGNQLEIVDTYRAGWFFRSSQGTLIWPGQKYVKVSRFWDSTGKLPLKHVFWDYYYTPSEYTFYCLQNSN